MVSRMRALPIQIFVPLYPNPYLDKPQKESLAVAGLSFTLPFSVHGAHGFH
jgi:hypothetical protein